MKIFMRLLLLLLLLKRLSISFFTIKARNLSFRAVRKLHPVQNFCTHHFYLLAYITQHPVRSLHSIVLSGWLTEQHITSSPFSSLVWLLVHDVDNEMSIACIVKFAFGCMFPSGEEIFHTHYIQDITLYFSHLRYN